MFWARYARQVVAEKLLNYKLERATARATPGVKFGQTPLKHGQHVKSSQRDYDANRGDRWEVQLSPRGGSGATGVARGGFAGSPRAASPGRFRSGSGMSTGAPVSPRDVQPWASTTPKAATAQPLGTVLGSHTNVPTSSMRSPPPVAIVAVDMDGDGKADFVVGGVDRDGNGIPDAVQERPCSVPSLPVTRPTSLSSVSQVAFCELDSYTAPGSYKDEEEEEEEVLPPPKKVPSLSLGISPCTA